MSQKRPEEVRSVLGVVLTIWLTACCGHAPSEQQSCAQVAQGAILITEVMASPARGTTDFEYVELLNLSDAPISLEGMRLAVQSDKEAPRMLALAADVIAPGQYFVVAKGPQGQSISWANRVYSERFPSLPATAGQVALRCADTLIDEVHWVQATTRGHARMLHPGALHSVDNDNEAAWCQAPDTYSYDGHNFGTPGEVNVGCPSQVAPGRCLEQGQVRAQRRPAVGDVWVSELMAAPAMHPLTAGEWIEIASNTSVDLNGLELVVNGRVATVSSDNCLTVSDTKPAVVASQVSATSLDGLVARVPQVLPNAGGQWQLRLNGLILDEGIFGPSSTGVALQMSSVTGTASDNDQLSQLCKAVTVFNAAMERGSPGRLNPSCELPADAGLGDDECIDLTTSVPRKIRAARLGDVSFSEILANPSAVDDSVGEFVEIGIHKAVDLNGVSVWHNGVDSFRFEGPACIGAEANTLMVLARNVDATRNGGIENVQAVFSFSLRNDAAGEAKTLELRAGDQVLDKIEYLTTSMRSEAGVSWQRQAGSEPPNAPKWCQTPDSVRFGHAQTGDRGTPGEVNVCR